MARMFGPTFGRQKRPLARARSQLYAGKRARIDQITRQMTSVTGHHTPAPVEQPPSAYVKALLDPEGSAAAIIPDISSYPSTCFTTQQTIDVKANSHGCAGIVVLLSNKAQYQKESSASEDTLYDYDAAVDFSYTTAAIAQYTATRLVGCSIRVEFTGTDQNNGGVVYALALGASTFDSSVPGTVAVQRDARDNYTGPARHGSYTTYRPSETTCLDFRVASATSYRYGTLQVHLGGLTDSTHDNPSPFNFIVTMHWEAYPIVGIASNLEDNTFVSVFPDVYADTIATAVKIPSSTSAEPAIIDRIASGISEVAKEMDRSGLVNMLPGPVQSGVRAAKGTSRALIRAKRLYK